VPAGCGKCVCIGGQLCETSFRNYFPPTPQRANTRIPDWQRVYAVGDIHGCADLFGKLISAIEADDRARGLSETTVILLGDLVDRGPDSRGVIDAVGNRMEDRLLIVKWLDSIAGLGRGACW
jgi:hypothetical protein